MIRVWVNISHNFGSVARRSYGVCRSSECAMRDEVWFG